MSLRRRSLPPGWYPESSIEIVRLLEEWRISPASRVRGGQADSKVGKALAAIAPHAGWTFSGRFAARAVYALAPAQTVAVIGGHLPAGYPILCAPEDSYASPLGPLEKDTELAASLSSLVHLEEDRMADNTVEIQLPLIKARFPGSRILWLRAPAGAASIDLGRALAAAAKDSGRIVVCLGSTDLTHYGPDYEFEPAGRGKDAEHWVSAVSDRGFMDAALALDAASVLERGGEGAACSSGAAAAAISFAKAMGAGKAELLGYGTSLEIRKAPSFVGYCAIGYYK